MRGKREPDFKIEEVYGPLVTMRSTGGRAPHVNQVIVVRNEQLPNPELTIPLWRVLTFEDLGDGCYRVLFGHVRFEELGIAQQMDELVFRQLNQIAREGV